MKNSEAFVLNLWLCQSASGDSPMAKKISKAHPFATVIGIDGFCMYGDRGGKAGIYGFSSDMHVNKKDGYIVYYQNGEEVKRLLYSDYLTQNKFIKL
jgi:hypothetical protein